MKFNSDKFSFNNIHCSSKQVSLLWGDETFIEYGLNINKPLSYDGSNWKEENEKPQTITLHITHEKNNIAEVWSVEKIREIESWLVTEDFVPFVSDDNENIIYYFKVVNIVRKFNQEMKGWLEVEFQPMNNYGYIIQNITLRNVARFLKKKTIPYMSIVNKSDLNKPYYPVIKIDRLDGDLTINNITTGQTFTISGQGDITIDNKMKTVMDSDGNNLINSCNRKWMYLDKGENKIQVVGDCTITFMSQYEVRI